MFRFDPSSLLTFLSWATRRGLVAALLATGLIGLIGLSAMAQDEAPAEEDVPTEVNEEPTANEGDEGQPPANKPPEKKEEPEKKPADPKTKPETKPTKPAQKPQPPVEAPAEEAEAEQEKPKPKPARPNPVQQIFKNIFQGRGIIPIPQPRPVNPKLIPGANGPAKPDDPNKPKDGEINLDTIDRRAPVENRQTALYERALRAADNEEWNLVIEVAEALFNPRAFPHDTLIRRKDGTLVSIRKEAIELIARVPEEHRRVYVEEFAKVAETMLAEAVASGDTRQMVEVATRYFWTPSGPKAADVLATRHLDRGEFTIAADWLEQLLLVKSPIIETASWKKKAALAFRMAGRDALAEQLKVETLDPNLIGERIATTKPRLAEEWPLLFGNSRRFTVGVGSAPVLLRRWTLPTTWNRPLEKKIDEMIDGFTDSNRATLPAPMPLLVNGKIICRTFRGVQVADAATGKPLWSTSGSTSVEAMLTGQMDNVQMQMAWNGNPGFFLQNSSSTNSAGGPLGQLIFQNSANGLLSSDGQRLYVVEDTPIFTLNRTSMRFGRQQNTNVFRGNRLKAYDLETGRPLWEAGGPASIEEFALPLSGHFFMGAPVADGGELFIITENDSEIRLQSLDPDTGHPNWSQPIAYAEKRIDQDLNRRMWSTQLAVADGSIICPTTVGWLVSVDRTRRSIQWAFRYAPRKKSNDRSRRRFGSYSIPNEAINSRWLVSAPIVRNDRLFFTPHETTDENNISTGTLVCIDLSTGKRLWQKPKGSFLYLAGVLEDRAILVGSDTAQAFSLTGQQLWSCTFNSEGKPSGRGVIVDGVLYQPMQRSELLSINLADGKVLAKQELPYGERPLGNLLPYRGMLISYHPAQVTAWEQKEALENQLAEIRSQSRDDVESLILEASAASAEGEHDKALSLLDKVIAGQPYQTADDLRRRVDDLVRQVIVSHIRRSPAERPELHDRLQKLVRSAQEEAENRQLKFVTLTALGQNAEAFQVLTQIIAEPTSIPFIRADNQRVEAEEDGWLSGHLRDTWAKLSEAEQKAASTQLEMLIENTNDDAAKLRLARLLAFHPSTEALREGFARAAMKAGHLHDAASWLRQSTWTQNLPVIAGLFVELIDAHKTAGDSSSAQQLIRLLDGQFNDQTLADGRKVAALVASLRKNSGTIRMDVSDWGEFDLKFARTATSYSYRSVRSLNPRSSHATVFDGLRAEWVQQSYGSVTQRLNFTRESDGSLYWSVPVRAGTSGPSVFRHFHLGSTMIVLNRGVISCLSIPDRRVVWTQLVGASDSVTSILKRNYRQMSTGSSFLNEVPGRSSMGNDPVPVVNSRYICYRARRKLQVLDTQSGDILWSSRAMPAGTRVFGTVKRVFIMPVSGGSLYSLRAIDGKRISMTSKETTDLRATLMTAMLIRENTIVTAKVQKGNASRLIVQARDLETDVNQWSHNFPGTSRFRGSADDELAILSKDGRLQTLDLLTGSLKTLGNTPEISARRTSYFVLSDKSRIYLLLNGSSRSRSYYGELLAIPASDDIVAFDRHTGKRIWHKNISDAKSKTNYSQSLVVTDLERNPVMILISNTYNQKLQTQLVGIKTIEKQNGRVLNEYSAPGYPGYRSLNIDRQRRYIDLVSYQDRVRLTAVPRKNDEEEKPEAAAGESALLEFPPTLIPVAKRTK